MSFKVCNILAACVLALGFGQLAAAGRSLLQDAPTDAIMCDVAIVGGGPGGVYSAFRLLETNASSNVCLFETNNRVGGRVYSLRNLGPKQDLVLDMGAYRYMPLSQPLITDIIQNLLDLPNRLYQVMISLPDQFDAQNKLCMPELPNLPAYSTDRQLFVVQPGVADYRVVLDAEGNNAGFATYVEKLFAMAEELGVKASFSTHINSIEQAEKGFVLKTATNTSITANKVVLNLATRPLHRLLQNSMLPNVTEVNEQLEAPYVNRATKLYLYYPQAWWLAAGLNNGSLQYVDEKWPPAKCALADGNGVVDFYYNETTPLNLEDCYGFFQATYTSDAGMTNISHLPVDYLVDYAGNLDTVVLSALLSVDQGGLVTLQTVPYSIWDNSTAKGRKLLTAAHDQLMAYHKNASILLPPGTATRYPTQAIVALWDPSITWIGGGWSSMKDPEVSGFAPNVDTATKPYADLDLFVANEAYSTQQGWSEGSLTMTENYLQRYFNVGIPSWMRTTTWPQINLVEPTFNDYEEAPQGIQIVPVTVANATAVASAIKPDTNATSTSG
ncbi:hypothetical protein ABBQ32_003893 [Trebouxia sp. C0010 RCD-2024]